MQNPLLSQPPPQSLALQCPEGGAATSSTVPNAISKYLGTSGANLTLGLVAALQPTVTALAALAGCVAVVYKDRGWNYDKNQLAVVQGFSHTHDLIGVQQIWVLFQTTKHAKHIKIISNEKWYTGLMPNSPQSLLR